MMSAAEILGLGGLRGELLPVPSGSMLLLSVPHYLEPGMRVALGRYLSAQFEQAGVDPSCVLVLEGGLTLETLTDERLAAAGLARIADA
jgi:hypothetical protein